MESCPHCGKIALKRDRDSLMNEKKTSINKKMLQSVILFAVVLVIATGTLVCAQYYFSQIKALSDRAFDYTRTLASLVDGDEVLEYVETGEKDEDYYGILDFMNATQLETDIKYYYVFVPYEDDLVYVLDATNIEGYCELGTHEEYMSEESKAATFEIMREDPPEKISYQIDEKYGYIASAYSPIFNSKGEAVAVAAVDLSAPYLQKSIFNYILIIMGSIFGITLIAMTLFYSMIDKRLIKPISLLTKSTGEMVDHIESRNRFKLEIDTGDEIEDLANSIERMDADLKAYVRKLSTVTAERERIGTELHIAQRIQEGMLPNIFPPYPDRNEFDLYASMTPAKEIGGDFYDFFMVDDDHIALVMADVSGKGVPAALFMAISKILIKTDTQAGMSPAEVMSKANKQLLDGNDTGMFVTVWLAVIEISTGKCTVANAGHEHPVLRRAGGNYELVKYRHSPAVSTIEGIEFREHEFVLKPGDSLFVYTDGVTEAINTDEELFGEKRLLEALNKNIEAEPEELLPAVKNAIDGFVGEAPQFDDITMLCFKYKGA